VGAGAGDTVLDGHRVVVRGLQQLRGAAGQGVEHREALHPVLSRGVAGLPVGHGPRPQLQAWGLFLSFLSHVFSSRQCGSVWLLEGPVTLLNRSKSFTTFISNKHVLRAPRNYEHCTMTEIHVWF